MAQPSSAQREPSMEEILASIRRIIEDSDAVRKTADEFGDAELEASNDVEGDVTTFRAEFETDAEAPSPASMADIQAALNESASAFGDAEARPAAEIHRFRSAEVEPAMEAAAERVEDEQVSLEAAPSEDAPSFDLPASAAEPTEPAIASTAKQSILSEQTGKQVAASFGELSDVFAASRRRSFDEMAEAMLRPMLQEWLDNNLPTLVEKLVREEIERVARGG
ncbi:DUF2497 domain-containing protein [Aquamicrobium sp. LC103]|uniref:PopZ family protein n=1 Tax=Aquamicrobium sp. LC103 TaxID=1120658 RepID=UPI00063EBE07|nr:DUF2497 domain-containing protein [Aquamicrobium sp. LC103]TKT76751.1 DUF2497 domain-containing protein [Aquamicrobium sp. LC103]